MGRLCSVCLFETVSHSGTQADLELRIKGYHELCSSLSLELQALKLCLLGVFFSLPSNQGLPAAQVGRELLGSRSTPASVSPVAHATPALSQTSWRSISMWPMWARGRRSKSGAQVLGLECKFHLRSHPCLATLGSPRTVPVYSHCLGKRRNTPLPLQCPGLEFKGHAILTMIPLDLGFHHLENDTGLDSMFWFFPKLLLWLLLQSFKLKWLNYETRVLTHSKVNDEDLRGLVTF